MDLLDLTTETCSGRTKQILRGREFLWGTELSDQNFCKMCDDVENGDLAEADSLFGSQGPPATVHRLGRRRVGYQGPEASYDFPHSKHTGARSQSLEGTACQIISLKSSEVAEKMAKT